MYKYNKTDTFIKNDTYKQVAFCLQKIATAAKENTNWMSVVIEVVENYYTIGKIADMLRNVFGEYQ